MTRPVLTVRPRWPTISFFLSSLRIVLKNLMVVDELPAWTSNRLKRLVLSPKRYLIDSALLGGVLGVDSAAVLRDGNLLGRLLETFVTAQLRAEATVRQRNMLPGLGVQMFEYSKTDQLEGKLAHRIIELVKAGFKPSDIAIISSWNGIDGVT